MTIRAVTSHSWTRRFVRSLGVPLLSTAAILALAYQGYEWARDTPSAPPGADSVSAPTAAEPRVGATDLGSATGEQIAQARPARSWTRVLTRLDRWRSEAWRQGDKALLRHVYVDSSAPLTVERHMLERYRDRSLRVTGVRLHFAQVALVERGRRRVVLDVVDQLGAMRAVSRHGPAVSLPLDQPTHHRIELHHTPAGWLIASVEAV